MPIRRDFKLYLNAGRSIPLVINASQYDRGEQWYFTLYSETGEQYYPDSAAIVGTKADGNLIANAAEADSRGYVIVTETEQMTAAAGKNKFELLIDDQTHGTANFVLLVEPSPADEGVPSESDLSLIQQAIDGTSATAIAAGVAAWMSEHLTPTTPVVDQSLTVQGAAADSKKVGDELNDLKSQITNSMPHAVKLALDTILQNVGFKNTDVYTDELATFHAWATAVNLLSISAVFNQGTNVIYDNDSLETLKQYLTVTASYDDGTSGAVSGYTLSGTLSEGTSTITVTYEDKTTTFNVNVTSSYLYTLESPFVSTGANNIDTGVAWEKNKQYSLECTFVIDQFTTSGTSYIYGDTHGESSKYTALAEQVVTSGTNAGRYVWGSGLGWADSKNAVDVNQTVKYLFTFDVGETSFVRNWYLKNTSTGTSKNGTQTSDTESIKGYNLFLGKQETSAGANGFVGTISDFKIIHGMLSENEISAYLNG